MSQDIRQEIQVGFIVFDQYRLAMEGLLRQGQNNLLTKIQRDFGPKVSLESFNPIVAHDFPKYLRYSIILLLYSYIETQLERVCINAGSYINLPENQVKDRIGNAGKLKGIKKFIKCVLKHNYQGYTEEGFLRQIDRVFEPILFLSMVRNCIAHAGGDISKVRNRNEIQKGEGKYSGFNITNDSIVIKEEFCEFMWIKAISLFEDLSHLRCM